MKHVDDFLNEAIFQNEMMHFLLKITLQLLVCNIVIVPIILLLMYHSEGWVIAGIGINVGLIGALSFVESDRLEAVEKAKQKQQE